MLLYKKGRVLVVLLGVKKAVWCLLGSSASKGTQRELWRYLLGYWAEKMWEQINCCLESVPLRGEKIQATPTKQDLGTFSEFFSNWNFQQASPSCLYTLYGSPPGDGTFSYSSTRSAYDKRTEVSSWRTIYRPFNLTNGVTTISELVEASCN